jgi:hypothetical protein
VGLRFPAKQGGREIVSKCDCLRSAGDVAVRPVELGSPRGGRTYGDLAKNYRSVTNLCCRQRRGPVVDDFHPFPEEQLFERVESNSNLQSSRPAGT